MDISTKMEEQTVTLTLPVSVLRQVAQVAEETNREIEQVLRSVVTHSFPALYVHPQRAAMQQEETVFRRMQKELNNKYPDQFVAIFDGQVIDHDNDEDLLLNRINNHYPTDIVLVRQVTDDLDKVLYVRSPRLLRDTVP
jgi:hypothetical protein